MKCFLKRFSSSATKSVHTLIVFGAFTPQKLKMSHTSKVTEREQKTIQTCKKTFVWKFIRKVITNKLFFFHYKFHFLTYCPIFKKRNEPIYNPKKVKKYLQQLFSKSLCIWLKIMTCYKKLPLFLLWLFFLTKLTNENEKNLFLLIDDALGYDLKKYILF